MVSLSVGILLKGEKILAFLIFKNVYKIRARSVFVLYAVMDGNVAFS